MSAVWDAGRWDADEWQGQPPEPGGWGADWVWWYQGGPQTGGATVSLNEMLVEARWTTDAHTMGDGSFRGDIQPGSITLQLWDPGHILDHLDKYGAVFATYLPTGAAWCWFYDAFTRGLVAPGDPAGADCVFQGVTWAARMTDLRQDTNYPAQSVAVRLAAVAASMGAAVVNLPPVAANIAAQTQAVPAAAPDSTYTTMYPGFLAVVRDAATNGVAWLSAAGTGPGTGRLTLNYAKWETVTVRTLDRSQIVAGPPSTAGIDFVLNWVQFDALKAGVTTTVVSQLATPPGGYQSIGLAEVGFRLYGDVSPAGPENQGAVQTGARIISDHADAAEQTLSTVDLQSGPRWTRGGVASNALWDPYGHTFTPTEVAKIDIGAGVLKQFRVIKSDHRLTSTVWQTTHYLEKYTAAWPLP